jgi:hypothetical protein
MKSYEGARYSQGILAADGKDRGGGSGIPLAQLVFISFLVRFLFLLE